MSDWAHDVFISYSSDDRADVERVVQDFRTRNIKFWWNQFIEMGNWGPELDRALQDSRIVLAFLTKSVTEKTFHNVYAEMRRAHEMGKLLPICIGVFKLPMNFDGIVAGLQTYYFASFSQMLADPKFARIAAICDNRELTLPAEPANSIDAWFSEASVSEIALALSIAALQPSPLDVVTSAARELEIRLAPPKTGDKAAEVPDTRSPFRTTRSGRLKAVKAVTFQEAHPRLGVQIEYVRFEDSQRAPELLDFVWKEMYQDRPPLIEWLNHLTGTLNSDGRLRLGLNIGVMARTDFAAIFETIVGRWVMDEHPARREVGDIALRIASQETAVEEAVKRIIANWATSKDNKKLVAAVELACGYTGMLIQDLPITTLKTVAKADNADFKVLVTMGDSIDFLLRSSHESADSSLLDIETLMHSLANWVEKPEKGTPQRLPMWLFLRLMEGVPLSPPKDIPGALSLETLLAKDATVPEADSTMQRAARVLVAALRDAGDADFSPRDQATKLIRKWLAAKKTEREEASDQEPDPLRRDSLFDFVSAAYRVSSTDRERDRLAHLVRGAYSEESLNAIDGDNVILPRDVDAKVWERESDHEH